MQEKFIDWPLHENGIIRFWNSGDIIHMYTPGTGIFYVLSGRVYIIRLLENGTRSILHVADKGKFFFENRYFVSHVRTSMAYAVTQTVTAYFPPEKVEWLIDNSPQFCRAMFQNMAMKNLNMAGAVVETCHFTAEHRLLNALYALSYQAENHQSSVLHMTQSELAEYVGKHPVTVNKTLKILEAKGFIKIRRGNIILELDKILDEIRHHNE